MSIEAGERATADIRTTQILFGVYVTILFIVSIVTASLHVHPNTLFVILSAVLAFAMTLGGTLYLGRMRAGDAKSRERYWAPFVIACIAFFGIMSVVLAIIFIIIAHKRLDSPALRDYFQDQAPLPWLAW